LPFFSHFVLQTGNWCPNTRLGCQFPMRNTKWLKNGKLRKAILSAFYNISQRYFGILLILWCSFKLWWNFCLDQNFSYKGKGPLKALLHYATCLADTIFVAGSVALNACGRMKFYIAINGHLSSTQTPLSLAWPNPTQHPYTVASRPIVNSIRWLGNSIQAWYRPHYLCLCLVYARNAR
jgi:hypothetical protein